MMTKSKQVPLQIHTSFTEPAACNCNLGRKGEDKKIRELHAGKEDRVRCQKQE